MKNRPITTQLVHLTYRLHGSLPTEKLQELQQYRLSSIEKIKSEIHEYSSLLASDKLKHYHAAIDSLDQKIYLMLDNALDRSREGLMFLSDPQAKKIIIDSWLHLSKQFNLTIYAVCVMSNHVHVILRGNDEYVTVDLKKMMEDHKHFTGTKINREQRRVGRRVWAKKTFDRDIRSGKFTQVLWYVINNPKKAGITDDPLSFCGLYLDPRLEEEYIAPYRCLGNR